MPSHPEQGYCPEEPRKTETEQSFCNLIRAFVTNSTNCNNVT